MIYEIDTEEEYQKGLQRFLEICGDLCVPEKLKELELLMVLMEKYERENCSTN